MKTNTCSRQSSYVVKKIISIIFFLFVFYVLPLCGKPQLLLRWQVIFLAAVCTLLYATQPRISMAESKNKNATDRNTMLLIIIVSGIGQIISLLEWAYISKDAWGQPLLLPPGMQLPPYTATAGIKFSIWNVIGAVLLIGGTVLRLYAIRTLGRYFTATVQIKEQHKIITAGPYKFLRHPSYTGAFIAMLGCALLLQSIAGLLVFGIAMLYVYCLRIETEEKTLIQNFGDEYLKYSRHTWKMFPLIW